MDFESIYKEYAELVYRYLFILCHDEHMAEELTQETFFQAIRSAKRYDETCKISTWLCQIAKHLRYQELERRTRKGTSELKEELISEQISIEEKILLQEDIVELYKRVHLLDEVTKEVFLLRITGELSFRVIGEILNKNENWARVTYYRAKQKIMKGWGKYEM